MGSEANDRRRRGKLAPSIQKAHRRVQISWYASIAHGVLLLGLGAYLLGRADPAWVAGLVCLVGAGVVPLLGRKSFLGNSFSALLLLATVVVPPIAAFLLERPMLLTLAGLPFIPVYFLGLKGANGLRGRRASPRQRARSRDRERRDG